MLFKWVAFLFSRGSSPGQNTGVGSLSLLQGLFPTQGLNPGLPYCRWILYHQPLHHDHTPLVFTPAHFPDFCSYKLQKSGGCFGMQHTSSCVTLCASLLWSCLDLSLVLTVVTKCGGEDGSEQKVSQKRFKFPQVMYC